MLTFMLSVLNSFTGLISTLLTLAAPLLVLAVLFFFCIVVIKVLSK